MTRNMVIASLAGMAMMVVTSGCGAKLKTTTPTPSTTKSSASDRAKTTSSAKTTHMVKAGPYTIIVPEHWTLGHQIKLKRFTASGSAASLLMPNPVPSNGNGIVNLLNANPFFSEQLNGVVNGIALQVNELTGHGTYYELTVTVPPSETSALKMAAKTLKTPPPATVTEDAHLIHALGKTPRPALYYTQAQVGSQDQWILVGGNPATAQEPFALYRSTDAGKQWTLADHTTFHGHSNFLESEGLPSIVFWNAQDGIMAESSSFAQSIPISYTTDGGKHWQAAQVPQVGEPTGQNAPTITRSANGSLEVKTTVFHNQTVILQSTDNGKNWIDISAPSANPVSTTPIVYSAQQRTEIAQVGHHLGFQKIFTPSQGIAGSTVEKVSSYHTEPSPSYPVLALKYSNFSVQEAATRSALASGGNQAAKPVTFVLPNIGPITGTWSLVYGHSNTPQSSVLQFPISGMVVQMAAVGTTLSEAQMVQIAKSYRRF